MTLAVSVQKNFGPSFNLNVAFETDAARLALLGPSGSGKSLTLRCVAGLERPDSGRIVLNGRVLFDSAAGINLPPQERRIGYLFQDYALFPHMTAAENIAAGARPGPAGAAVVRGLLRDFRLESLAPRRPAELSGGEKQRVALARLLAAAPEAALLDEPFSALDGHLRERTQTLVQDALAGVSDVVMVTHSLPEAYRLCSRLLAMENGQASAMGSTREVFAFPRRLSVARLTGCGNISRAEKVDRHRLRAVDWGLELTCERDVGDAVSHVAVREHAFRPFLPGTDGPAANAFAVRIIGVAEEPFGVTIRFDPAGAEGGTENAGIAGELLWKTAKPALSPLPGFLCVPEKEVLPLEP